MDSPTLEVSKSQMFDDRALFQFIKDGNNDVAMTLIDHLLSYGTFDEEKKTLLHYAAQCDNPVITQYLIDRGWDSEAKYDHEETPLMIAIRQGIKSLNIPILLDAVKGHLDINEYISLTKCRWPNDLQIVKVLLDKLTSACTDNKEKALKLVEFQCPLGAAVWNFRDTELTKLMLDQGCPVDGRLGSTGETALHLAVECLDIDNVKLLVDHGAEIDALDDDGGTPMSRFKVRFHDSDEKLQILRLLLERGASLNARCSRRRQHDYGCHPTVMRRFLTEADNRTLRLVIPYIDFLVKDANGEMPLFRLITNPNPDVLKALRGKSLNVNERDANGRTCLDLAVYRKDLGKVRCLLEMGANPNTIDNYGNPIWKYIQIRKSESTYVRDIIEVLLTYDVDPRLLMRNYEIMFGSIMRKHLPKLLIAHFAKLESLGVPLNDFIDQRIKGHSNMKDYFNSCRQQIENMKEITVYESVTLYTLLSESQKRLIVYAQNKEFQLNHEFLKNSKHRKLWLDYVNTITWRVDNAIVIADMKNEVAGILYEITGLPTSICYNIVDYLNRSDLEKSSSTEELQESLITTR